MGVGEGGGGACFDGFFILFVLVLLVAALPLLLLLVAASLFLCLDAAIARFFLPVPCFFCFDVDANLRAYWLYNIVVVQLLLVLVGSSKGRLSR